jgi:predicted permease
MSAAKPALPDRLYEAMLYLLPFDFRSEYGSEMAEVFREQRRNRRSFAALAGMWAATIRDLIRLAPREHLSILAQDTRYALRSMSKHRGYALAAIVILGLGIGVNSAIFSAANSILWKPLPYAQDRELVVLHQEAVTAGIANLPFSPPEMEEYRLRNRTLSGVAEHHTMLFTLFTPHGAERVRTGVVSANFFGLFGVKPILGRSFQPADEGPNAKPVLLLSYEYWKRTGADPFIAGKTFEMNDRVHTAIGVLPPIPQYPLDNDVYMTTSSCPFRSAAAHNRDWRLMTVFGRLRPGIPVEHCREDLARVARGVAKDNPRVYTANLGYGVFPAPLLGELTRRARGMLVLLLATAAFVLIIACSNVANLILARTVSRRRELSIRAALGAGSGRLLRQLVTESLILALCAGALGLVLASASISLLAQFTGQLTPRAREIALDGRVLLFAFSCAAGTAVLFGSLAAVHCRRGIEPARSRLRGGLIAAQVAFSFMLLIGAGLTARSFAQLEHVDPGFNAKHVLAVGIDLNWSKYREPEQIKRVAAVLLQKIQAQPDVLSAAVSSGFPLSPDGLALGPSINSFYILGREGGALPLATLRSASADYFRTLDIPLLEGRNIGELDNEAGPPNAILSESLARRYWHRQSPIGARISFDNVLWLTVVGVAGDVKEFGVDRIAQDQVYVSTAQFATIGSVLVRTAGDAAMAAAGVQRLIHEVDPQIAITFSNTLEQARMDSVSSPHTTAILFGLFAILALVIATAGLASMLGLAVKQHTREIGIRMALGATPAKVASSFVRQGLTLVGLGLAFGILGALALTGFLKSVLFGVSPNDPATFLFISGLLFAVALPACYMPARRAAHIDPQLVLRSE